MLECMAEFTGEWSPFQPSSCPPGSFRTFLALRAVRIYGIGLPAFKPRLHPAVGVLLDCPKALMADVHVATVRLFERLVGPYHADPEPGRTVAVDGNLHRPFLPVGIALLADWQGTFLGQMP